MRKMALLGLLLCSSAYASLIIPAPTPVTQASTLAQKQAATQQTIQQVSTQGFRVLQQSVTAAFNLVWNNRLGLTPTQAEAALGTDACTGHMLLLAAGQILNSAQPGSFTLIEPCTVTCNSDGTVTLSACASPSPSPSPSGS